MMQTLIIGQACKKDRKMHAVACEAAIMPGKPMGDVFAAHAKVFDKVGLSHARRNACGYAMGAIYNPI